MRFTVTGVTGNVGSKVASLLAEQGHEVRAVLRDEARMPETLRLPNVEARVGDHLDSRWIADQTKDSDGLFWMVPMALTGDILSFQHRAAEAGRSAALGVRRVAFLSGLYCDRPDAGLASWLRFQELAIEAASRPTRFLRAGLFMENFLLQSDLITQTGTTTQPTSPNARTRFVATRDIAECAVSALLETGLAGASPINVVGPEELSFTEAAAILSRVAGKEVRFQESSAKEMTAALVGAGLPAAFVEGYVAMFRLFDLLFQRSEPLAGPVHRGTTTLEDLVRDELAERLFGS